MKGILRFNLDDYDDSHAFKLASRASEYQLFIWKFGQDVLRKYDKYGLPENLVNKSAQEMVSHIREQYIQLFNDMNLEDPL